MTDFRGVTTDKEGRRQYLYACRQCGCTVKYKSKHKSEFPAICGKCKRENSKNKELDKKKAHDDSIWAEAVMAYCEGAKLVISKTKTPWLTKKQVIDILDNICHEMTIGKENE